VIFIAHYYPGVGRITSLPVHLSVRLSVCPIRSPNSKTQPRRNTKIGAKVLQGRGNQRVSIFSSKVQWSRLGLWLQCAALGRRPHNVWGRDGKT